MNLKEAFRFQNKLQSLMEEAQSILGNEDNITRVQNTYLRKKVMKQFEDETTEVVPSTEYSGQITSVEIVQAYLRAIDARDGEVHAYLETYPDDALREAAESDRRRAQGRRLSPLDGVPIAVKDNLVMRGRVCSCASRMLESFRSPYDATVIQLSLIHI